MSDKFLKPPLLEGDRTAVVIDGPSFSSLPRRHRVKVDFHRLMAWLHEKTYVAHTSYLALTYIAPPSPDEDVEEEPGSSMQRWFDFLRYNGWTLRERKAQTNFDPDLEREVPDFDNSHAINAEIARLVINNKVEQILILGSNPKYADMIELARERGIRVVVMSSVELGQYDKSMLPKLDGFVEFTAVCNEFSTPASRFGQAA